MTIGKKVETVFYFLEVTEEVLKTIQQLKKMTQMQEKNLEKSKSKMDYSQHLTDFLLKQNGNLLLLQVTTTP